MRRIGPVGIELYYTLILKLSSESITHTQILYYVIFIVRACVSDTQAIHTHTQQRQNANFLLIKGHSTFIGNRMES